MMITALIENLRIAMVSLWGNKLRGILTMLGIIIGVAAVVILLSLGQGVQSYITGQFESLGASTIRVSAIRDDNGDIDPLTLGQIAALENADRAPSVAVVMPQVSGNYPVVYGGEERTVSVQGVTTEYLTVEGREVNAGRFFTEAEVGASARVAMIGTTTAENLFATADPVGENIRVGSVIFEVVGVLEETGDDDLIVVPYTTVQARLDGERTLTGDYTIDLAFILATSNDLVQQAIDEITRVLRDVRGLADNEADNFRVFSASTILDSLTEIIEMFTIFLGVIAGISLVVGGIGVMNIMLVTVNERTREIGLRKAVGAQSWDIVIQFLIEAAIITLAGGFIGILLALAATSIVTTLVPDFTAIVQVPSILFAVMISAFVGIFFGVYPAQRASKLHPIDALRYE